jgi:hypothetical protein
MAPPRKQQAAPLPADSADAAGQHPPFWIADRVLPVGSEMGDGMPARAFSPGDRVPAEHVDRFGWQEFVSAPDGDWPLAEIPEQPELTSTAAQPGSQAANDEPGSSWAGKE